MPANREQTRKPPKSADADANSTDETQPLKWPEGAPPGLPIKIVKHSI